MATDEVMTELKAAVEAAYAAFAAYRPGPQSAVCRCPRCLPELYEERLLSTPLREIEREWLCEYTDAADVDEPPPALDDEVRYFLPRYFELIAAGDYPHYQDWDPTLRRLGKRNFRSKWPAVEVAVIDRYFAALFAVHLSHPIGWTETVHGVPYSYSEVPEILCLIAIGGGDIEALLSAWDRNRIPDATAHVAAIVVSLKRYWESGLGSNLGPFWSEVEAQSARIIAWLCRAETAERLAAAQSAEPDEKMQALYAEGEAAVRWLMRK